jgi:hypothetical protein
MTIKNKLKAILAGQRNTLTKGDVQRIVNHIKNLEAEVKRLSQLKSAEIEITIE